MERKSRGEQPSIEVTVEHVPAPDAKERLAKAYRIILAAAPREKPKEKPTESDGGPENDATRSASSTPESESADDRDGDHGAN